MEYTNRKSVSTNLKNYDHLAKEHSFVQVTEWDNGEGWDIIFDEKVIALTRGQVDAIIHLTMSLDYCEDEFK